MWLVVDEILKVVGVIFYVVGESAYPWTQIMAKFKHVQGKMEGIKSKLEINFYHPLQNVITIVLDVTNLSLKRRFDFFDYMKFKSIPTKNPSQPNN